LVEFLQELRLHYPDLYLFVTENKIVHLGSGKYLVGDAADIAAVEAPQTAVPALATPKRRTISRTATSPHATLNLSSSQKNLFQEAPAIVTRWDSILASLICMCMTTQTVRNQLFTDCGTSGRAMLLFIEKRGTGAAGTPLALLARKQLAAREVMGVSPPISSTTWTAYAQEMERLAAGAGGISEADMANHLLMPLYALPERLSHDCLAATTSLTKPSEIIPAVAATMDTHAVRALLAARLHDPTYGTPTLAATVEPLERDDFRDPPAAQPVLYGQRRDPPKHVSTADFEANRRISRTAPPADTRWSASEHGPCLNWVRNRDGCDGRHHLRQCPLDPLPRPVGAVTTEDTPAPPDFAPAAVLTAVPTAPAEPVAKAARDFSSLFMGGPKEISLDHGIAAVLNVTAVAPVESPPLMLFSTPGSLVTLNEMKHRLDAVHPFPPMPRCDV
jgi:hypothetical protein